MNPGASISPSCTAGGVEQRLTALCIQQNFSKQLRLEKFLAKFSKLKLQVSHGKGSRVCCWEKTALFLKTKSMGDSSPLRFQQDRE